jgi:hypothetical protein
MSGALRHQIAYMFVPNDPRLRRFAAGIAEQRRHSLRKSKAQDDLEGGVEPAARERPAATPDDGEQLSLFAPISAIPLDEARQPIDPWRIYEELDGDPRAGEPDDIPGLASDDEGLDLPSAAMLPELAAAVPLPEPSPDRAPVSSPRHRRRQLREDNSFRVRTLVHLTRMSHAEVNAELNRRVGIRRVTEATIAELERRLDAAERWLKKLT